MDKPENPAAACACKHPRYLHRPGWCRGYWCDCKDFKASPTPDA
jgi:hypothetical protein